MDRTPPAVDTHVPRGPSFSLVVAIAIPLLFIILAVAWFLIRREGRRLVPASPLAAPTALILR